MSEGRLGNVLIAENGALKAVLSDGDLRRALMRDDFSMEVDSITYASKNPKYTTNADMLASDALKLIEEHKLQHLVVTDTDKKIKGVLHIHDLVEAGIK
jgi:arabinose-5-phosphate isomerase